jgi:hypothetical protein
MSYALVEDVAASWESYERFAADIERSLPDGLILHAAGRTDEGFRIIEVWETEEAWQRFRSERLDPTIAALRGPGRPEPTFRDLHPEQVLLRHREPTPKRGGGKEER